MKVRVAIAVRHALVAEGLEGLLARDPAVELVGRAADGVEAIALVVGRTPDVLLLEIALPGLDALEATRELARSYPGTAVIILSTAPGESAAEAMASGARGYLFEDSIGSELLDAVRTAAAGGSYLNPRLLGSLIDRNARLAPPGPLALLSPREREVLRMVVEGHSSAAIGKALHLAPGTVDTYRSRLMQKLDVRDLPGLVRFALRHGLTPP
jgi:DNA-binding NarL/FixJ family response regulator